MLWTIIAILVVLWLLGFVAFHTLGPIVHVLLVIAVVLFIVQLVTGNRTVA